MTQNFSITSKVIVHKEKNNEMILLIKDLKTRTSVILKNVLEIRIKIKTS